MKNNQHPDDTAKSSDMYIENKGINRLFNSERIKVNYNRCDRDHCMEVVKHLYFWIQSFHLR